MLSTTIWMAQCTGTRADTQNNIVQGVGYHQWSESGKLYLNNIVSNNMGQQLTVAPLLPEQKLINFLLELKPDLAS